MMRGNKSPIQKWKVGMRMKNWPVRSRSFMAGAALILSAHSVGADAQTLCDMAQYRSGAAVKAEQGPGQVTLTWPGDPGEEVRFRFVLDKGVPVIRELALRRGAGEWTAILANVTPEFRVATGLRRMSEQQIAPLRDLGVKIDRTTVGQYRWDPFWDAPLDQSPAKTSGIAREGSPPEGIADGDQPGLPRPASEMGHASVSYHVTGCAIRSENTRLSVEFPGVHLGPFEGMLVFTFFPGSNLIQQELVAKTQEKWLAYKYDAGLAGLSIGANSRVVWRDTSGTWQDDHLGGVVNAGPVPLRAAKRLVTAEQGGGSITVFPPPHKLFWAREFAINVGYDWYRKESEQTYSIGIRQNDHEDFSKPDYQGNWALYSARPGTEQRMTLFLYPSLGPASAGAEKAAGFTHSDTYKPMPGFQVMNHHYHMDMGQRLLQEGSPDVKLPDLSALKALGINIVSPVDSMILTGFTGSGAPSSATGPEAIDQRIAQNRRKRAIMDMAMAGARAHSDQGFLILPSQELFNGPLGGHTDFIFSHRVVWDERLPGQAFEEGASGADKVYHIGSADDLMRMARAENAIIVMPHPRTKGSTGFPDAVKDSPYFADPDYLGFGMRWGMGLDGSETQLCQYRCWPLLDEAANWMVAKGLPPKRMLSISEVFAQSPGDDIYGSSPVTYLKLARLPVPEDVSPVIEAIKTGYSFWTTGEVLIPSMSVKKTASGSVIALDAEWTFPLSYMEITWGDGKTMGRRIIGLQNYGAFGSHHFEIPFDLSGKKWFRLSLWDVAANGAVLQPSVP